MTSLKEVNRQYKTDWKRGDIVELLPEDGGGRDRYQLTGRCMSGHWLLWGKRIKRDWSKSPHRMPFHPKSIRIVNEE